MSSHHCQHSIPSHSPGNVKGKTETNPRKRQKYQIFRDSEKFSAQIFNENMQTNKHKDMLRKETKKPPKNPTKQIKKQNQTLKKTPKPKKLPQKTEQHTEKTKQRKKTHNKPHHNQ